MQPPTAPAAVERTDMATGRALLDEALLGLRAIADPNVRARDAEAALAQALVHAYRALGCRGDYNVFHDEAAAALARARDALGALMAAASDDAGAAQDTALVARAVRALGAVAYVPSDAPVALPGGARAAAPSVLRASVGEPRLLELERGVLYPAVPLPELGEPTEAAGEPAEPEAPPATSPAALRAMMERLLAEAEAPADAPPEDVPDAPPAAQPVASDEELERELFGVRLAPEEVAWDRARACVEDLAALGMMRVPLDGEGQSWTGRERTEQRLLTKLDALVACGIDVLPRAVKLLESRPLPDPDLTWALLFAFGSIAGDDARDQCVRLASSADVAQPEMLERVADALALAPHPGLVPALRVWLADADPARRIAAVRALGRRGVLQVDEAVRATADPDVGVVEQGARALAVVAGEVHAFVFEPLLARGEEAVVRAALASALARRLELAPRWSLQQLREGRGAFADAAVIAALGARGEDARAALEQGAAAGGPSAVLLEALGWFGEPAFVGYLLARLDAEEPAQVAAAAEALQRITGASVSDDGPPPEYEAPDRPFVRAGFAAPPPVATLATQGAVWRAWWRAHGGGARVGTHYRHGHAWGPRDALRELEAPLAPHRARRLAHLELAARAGLTAPLDTEGFVARQRRQIDAIRAEFGARGERTAVGEWPVRLRR